MRASLLVLIFSFLYSSSSAISDTLKPIKKTITPTVLVTGKVTELKTGAIIPSTLIIQKGVGGTFLKPDGTFKITIKITDTLLVSSLGYGVQKFCFKDSTGSSHHINVRLSKLQRDLETAVIMPKRALSEIHKDFDELRLELPKRPTGVDAISSPITALYEKFSKMAKSKALVATMEHRDQKHDLLKELFKIYVDADVINLSPDEFENFIYFTNVSDNFLRSASEYELITFFQSRYKEYVALKQ